MGYGFLRLIFWGIVFVVLRSQIIKKSTIIQKKRAIIFSFVLCMMLGTASNFTPVENLFFDFETPVGVLNYFRKGKENYIIEGSNSSMIIYSDGDSERMHLIVPRTLKGYKIPSLFSVKQLSSKFDSEGYFDVYNVVDTNDYYVFGSITLKAEKINVTDSNGKNVKTVIKEMGDTGVKSIFIYSFVENFTKEYYFIVNGEKIMVSN